MTISTESRDIIESRLGMLFSGQFRKDNTTPMVVHSIDVARRLERWGLPDPLIVAGYFHDVLEDVPEFPIDSIRAEEGFDADVDDAVVVQSDRLAIEIMGTANMQEPAVAKSVELVQAVTYTEAEYAAERLAENRDIGKQTRKSMASERWSIARPDIQVVKCSDILSNLSSMAPLSGKFKMDYTAWAIPLLTIMHANLVRHNVASPEMSEEINIATREHDHWLKKSLEPSVF